MSVNSCLEWWCSKSKDFRLFLIGIIITFIIYMILGLLSAVDFNSLISVLIYGGLICGFIVGVWLVVISAFWDLANDSSKGPGKNLLGLILALLFSGLFGLIILFIIKYLFIQLPCRKYNTLNVKEENAEIT